MEGILGAAAVRGRVRQRADGVDHLDHGAGPAVGHDQRQRVLVLGPDVDEVDVHAVDLGDELRQRVQPRLDPPEVVLRRPVARELLNRRQLHALRPILNELLARPTRRRNASTEVVQDLVRNLNLEGADVDAGLDGATHEAISLRVGWGFGLTSSLGLGTWREITLPGAAQKTSATRTQQSSRHRVTRMVAGEVRARSRNAGTVDLHRNESPQAWAT